MTFFRKNNKVAPAPDIDQNSEKAREIRRNNYINSNTYYFCLRGKADAFIDKILESFNAAMAKEQHAINDNATAIEQIEETLLLKQEQLVKSPNMRVATHLNNDIKGLEKYLAELDARQTELEHTGSHYIAQDSYHDSEISAVFEASQKYSQYNISLIKVDIPIDKFNQACVGEDEVTRPDLMKRIVSIKSITQEDMQKIKAVQEEVQKQPLSEKDKSKKIREVSSTVIHDIVDNAIEYKKSVITKSEPVSQRARASTTSQRFSASSISQSQISVMPTIHEVDYIKVFQINPKTSVAFEKVEPKKQELSSTEPSPRSSSRRP